MRSFVRSKWPLGVGLLIGAASWSALAVSACSSSGTSASPPGDAGSPDTSVSSTEAGPATDAAPTDANDAAPDAPTGDDTTGCALDEAGASSELRCTGLYSDFSSKTIASNVHEFDPGLHLWSDGAVKTRWIYLPPDPSGDGGTVLPIDTSDMNEWTFPVGTKLWKQFVLEGKLIETRLLWKQASASWYRTTYLWSPDGSSATELTLGELDADGNGYEVPNQAACLTCHKGRVDNVLGFEAVSLSSPDASPLTMQTLAGQGWITKVPEASIVIPGNPTDVAALAYLHANCGTACHNSGNGAAEQTGLFMRLEVGSMSSLQETATWQTGVNQPSFFKVPGTTSSLLVLAPGDADASCVYVRMSHRTGVDDAAVGIQMPPIDTHKVDEAGVALISGWINNVLPEDVEAGSDQ